MKLKLVVVDLELSRRQRMLGAAGLGAAILMVGAVAVADVPNTFVAGDTLTAAGLNENFGSLDTRITALESQTESTTAALATGCGPKSALASVTDGEPVCTPANDVVAVRAEVTGSNGGSSAAVPCPAGYTLIAVAQDIDQRTQSGINGWDLGGTTHCGISGNSVVASIGQYANGTSQTLFSCYGVCVRD